MRRKARVDANHGDVIQALRSAGYVVIDASRVGGGFPDAIAMKHGRVVFVEIKNGAKVPSARKLTADEAKWHETAARAGVIVQVITSVEDAIRL